MDLNAAVRSTMTMARGWRRSAVGLELDPAPLPPVTCHPAQINQVVMNLVSNAIEACVAGGRVAVTTRPGAEGVEIHVADDGRGIEPAIRDNIFDPFFTTKPVGQGAGLGLSISYGIVKDHGGSIDVESEPGRGTRFVVRLPCTPAGPEPSPPR
ncbi:MAG: ATP-binding protein [Singulisphaera sp.]